MNDNEIVKLIEERINPSYLTGSSLILHKNAENSSYDSVLIKSPNTLYRNAAIGNKSILFCRIKNKKKLRYVSFAEKYESDFIKAGFNTSKTISDNGFIRIDIDEFIDNIDKSQLILNKVFMEAFSFAPFGCCSRYEECSRVEHCIHEDQLYSTSCMYRKNLENGRNFYKE